MQLSNSRKTSRVTVLKRSYYKRGRRSGGNWTTEVDVLPNITSKDLEGILAERNKGLRSNLWVILGDYDLSKKRDQKAYLDYCLSCFFDPHTYDSVSRSVGHKMVYALTDMFDGLKGENEEPRVWASWTENE